MMGQIFGNFPEDHISPYDCLIQIAFRDAQDYINVTEDPQFKEVVFPDHAHFADTQKTTVVTGWLETHLVDGKLA